MRARQKFDLRIRQLVIFLFLLAPITASADKYLEKDTVFLRNGEKLIGDIRELRIGILSFDSKDVGLVSLKISKIKTFNSSSDTLRIETVNKEIYFGALKPSVKPGWVYIVTASDRHLIEIGNINSLLSYQKNFWHDLSGSVSSGFSYSHSSGIGQLNISFSVAYTAKRFELSMSGSGISSIDTLTFSRDREDYNITALINIKNMWYGFMMFEYQRNLELSISRRFQQLGGAGYKFVFNQNTQILGMGGLGISQERSTAGTNENFLFEIPIGFSFDYYKFSKPNIQITSQHVFYTGLTQWGRVRYDANTAINWELFKDFSFSFNIYLDYDSQPPDPTSGKTDYGTVVGLSYKF
jgi:hypothetical protein